MIFKYFDRGTYKVRQFVWKIPSPSDLSSDKDEVFQISGVEVKKLIVEMEVYFFGIVQINLKGNEYSTNWLLFLFTKTVQAFIVTN